MVLLCCSVVVMYRYVYRECLGACMCVCAFVRPQSRRPPYTSTVVYVNLWPVGHMYLV